MVLTKTRVIACIYSVYTLIYCLRLYLYNGQLKQLEKQGYNIFYLLSANHYAAIIYFLKAIVLCVVAIFIEFFLFKSFGEINGDKEFLINIATISIIFILVVLTIKLITIPILRLICKAVFIGGTAVAFMFLVDSES